MTALPPPSYHSTLRLSVVMCRQSLETCFCDELSLSTVSSRFIHLYLFIESLFPLLSVLGAMGILGKHLSLSYNLSHLLLKNHEQ